MALIGANGAGKTTLLLHLNGLITGQGYLKVAGHDLSDCDINAVRRELGMVFQNPQDQLFLPTVFDDVAFGPVNMGLDPKEVRTAVTRALEAVEMSGYEKRVSHHLSLGEQKRIAIATVLSMEPQILALDEPTLGLDPRARRRLMELLDALDKTMIVSTHDLEMAREILPVTAIMRRGTIFAVGPTSELLSDQPLLDAAGLL